MYRSMLPVRLSVVRPCRFIAHRRYPAPTPWRRFHLSRQWLSTPSQDPNEPSTPEDIVDNSQSPQSDDTVASNELSSPFTTDQAASRPYGPAVRRAMRNRLKGHDQQKQQDQQSNPPQTTTIPNWFSEYNTVTRSLNGHDAEPPVLQVEITKSKSIPKPGDKSNHPVGGEEPPSSEEPSVSKNRYAVSDALWDELRASARAGLRLPPDQYAKEPAAKKSHLVLQYPGNDGILFLNAVVQQLSHDLNTDLITLNALDIAQLFSEQDFVETGATSPIRSLGYEVYRPQGISPGPESVDAESDGDEDMDISPMQGGRAEASSPHFITIEPSRQSNDVLFPNWSGLRSLVASINGQVDQDESSSRHFGKRAEKRWSRLLDEIISSASQSTEAVPKEMKESPEAEAIKPVHSRDTIIHIQDYRDIQNTREGARFISLLQKAIQDRRRSGTRLLFIGSTSQGLQHSSSPDGIKILQNVIDDNFSKTLIITPAMESKAAEKNFAEDQKIRTMDINVRHLQNMLRYRINETSSIIKNNIFANRDWELDAVSIKQSGIRDRFWSYNQVHWVATLALGSADPSELFGFEQIRRGIELMDRGDKVTSDWLQEKASQLSEFSESSTEQTREQLLSSLRKTCNTHEKKLLNGVVDAKSLRTTFADVHVPAETIDALKMLTSLSLIRPEAFTYGVLATDKIPGLLLYGPPGTGKTLLAKAVARESGATVLEVSGSEVYDMYVGEGEKNVKAIFTLAKKLSPCVVFIDEADAILCSRTSSSNRSSHRELINQFLREWDGMSDTSAFIMVATNRPFDLDDAVLRRLPRRILVDLPTEKDREQILKIHLKEEKLDPTVDFAELAKQTPLYSGSDLKNLAVSAALACVREENDLAAKHQGDEPYQHPERRTLTRAHFERGMGEISASISEDMSSLAAIRKFDEQYGDRKSRRQRSPALGFGSPKAAESTPDTVRVRA
ncbi:hypothetical protein N7495_004078 [Penicillium taxi]|uniref:uncharacterized protein n=1 Tax=Penicillium taxi TaxID=168475 RepID=UPI0025454776|nr:uncharacterized protein N7495_004078 [Penicillium taxi]KAJ5899334.1 hypothetical protein N7495_004078 [Penicillium taxi]